VKPTIKKKHPDEILAHSRHAPRPCWAASWSEGLTAPRSREGRLWRAKKLAAGFDPRRRGAAAKWPYPGSSKSSGRMAPRPAPKPIKGKREARGIAASFRATNREP